MKGVWSRMSRRRLIAVGQLAALTLVAGGAAITADRPERALATLPNGTRILHVPMSWCVVRGTPADVAPNVTSEGSTVADTDTNAVIWRRHERPTDNVFLPQASVSLRSSINNSWGTLSFPKIADPDTSVGQQGDVVATLTRNAELVALEHACETEYARMGRAGMGIIAINVGLFRQPNGTFTGDTGLGGCGGISGGACTSDFWIFVNDNRWYYPTVPNRNVPGFGVPWADPLDLIVAHETGHALNLPHRTDATALMNRSLVDGNGDLRVENTQLNASEVTALRATANNVPGLESDPPGQFVPGPLLAMRLFDGPQEQGVPPYRDLDALTLSLDRRGNKVQISQRLWGLLPCTSLTPTQYQYFADLDNKRSTGASNAALATIQLPTSFRGADLIARTTVVGGKRPGPDFRTCRSRVDAWIVTNGRLLRLPRDAFNAHIKAMRIYVPHYPTNNRPSPLRDAVDVLNMIDFTVQNVRLPIRIQEKKVVRLFTQIVSGRKLVDRFGAPTGARFILEHPRFPHCFPSGTGAAGGTVNIAFDGLRPEPRNPRTARPQRGTTGRPNQRERLRPDPPSHPTRHTTRKPSHHDRA